MPHLGNLLVDMLPRSLGTYIRRIRYLRRVQRFPIDEEPDLKIVSQLVSRGNVAVDVGASIGVYSHTLSRLVGDEGRVISFEPVPSTFDTLSYICRSLHLNNIDLHNLALGSSKGRVSMCIPKHEVGGGIYRARIVSDSGAPSSGAIVSVEMTTLDWMMSSIEPSFIKIDVEGHELETVHGAMQTIKRHLPSLLVEVNDQPEVDSEARQLFDVLTSLKYTPFWYDGTELRTRQRTHDPVNVFFLQARHVEELSSQGAAVQLIQ